MSLAGQSKTSSSSLGIVLLCISTILQLVVLYWFVAYLIVSDESRSEKANEEIIIFELVYGVLFAVGLAFRQEWARIGLLFNAYFLLLLATIGMMFGMHDPIAKVIRQSAIVEVALLILLHSSPVRHAIRRKSVAQPYTYTSNRNRLELESSVPPVTSQEKEGQHADRSTTI